ncbi:MAG: DUF4412 domain-containing protein [Acidobacteria bacterium]|nr:DUF4412 domain-containing protein [Acidobacteriota bacterium]
MKTFSAVIGLCVLAAGLGAPAQAGVVIELEQREPGSEAVVARSVHYLDAGRLRIETKTPEGDDIIFIFRADRETAWAIDPASGTYTEWTPAQVAEMKKHLEESRRQMKEQLAQLPAEQRKAIEEMMQGALAEPATVRKVAQGEAVGRFVCTRYEMLTGGRRTSEVWAAPPEQLQMQVAEYDTFRALGRLFDPLGAQTPVSQLSGAGAIDGFPVRSVYYDNGRPVLEERVVKAERQSLPATLFELPAGLRKSEFGPEE